MSSEFPTLQITAHGVQHTFTLFPYRFRVGRSSKADIYLSDYRVSRTQSILIYYPNGRCLVVDGNGKTGSRNGTFVNGVRVKRRLLEDQDVLFLGSPGVTAQIFLPRCDVEVEDDPLAGDYLLPDDVPTEVGLGFETHFSHEMIHWSLREKFQDH